MYKIGIGMLCLILFVGFGMTMVSGQDSNLEMRVPMGSIPIKSIAVEGKSNKDKVEFPHSVHFKVASCTRCHHKWEGNGNIQGCMTSNCHDSGKVIKKSSKYLSYDKDSIKYFKYAYHKQCIGCHKDIKKKNKEIEASQKTIENQLQNAGPTGCVGCHPAQ